jgi:hypothetical protein
LLDLGVAPGATTHSSLCRPTIQPSIDKLLALTTGLHEHREHSLHMAVSASPGGPCLAWAWMDVMELAGRLAQQHAQELKEVLQMPGDEGIKARTQLQALAQALHHILSTTTITSDGGEQGREGATAAMEEEGEERSSEEVSSSGHCRS